MFADFAEFKGYGKVLRDPGTQNTELFKSKDATGWRVAELPVYERNVTAMSLHDNTPEAFFPMEGETVLVVANREDFSDCKAFLLDRPVVIHKHVWHGLAAPGGESRVLVLENSEVNLIKKPFSCEGVRE